MKIKKIIQLDNEDVFNMEVEKHHNFLVNGGVVVHNCDAIRYLLADRPPQAYEDKNSKKYDDDDDDDVDTWTSSFYD